MASQFGETSLRNSCLAFIQLNFNIPQRVRSLIGKSSAYNARGLAEIYILSSRHPLQKIRFAKGRMLKMDTFEQLKKCLTARFELITNNCKSPRNIVGLKEGGWVNRRNAHDMVEAMLLLDVAGKNGWAVADFSVMRVVVDLVPQQIRRTD
ncbi:hypothetical protein TNCV_2562131 [Trichonephila clavipes]|uniref:Uncharacterized protein n=1 Tax=Trichonephila clavipes TaxID=2585209 RepID=A0A8X6R6R8_TRICX|nr:hypothetical protein TNCV_2562131 [Trichonephila clavipes]